MFFKKSKDKSDNNDLTKVAALLIHAAKIDENYSQKEQEIIKKTLIEIGAKNENLEKIMNNAQKIEENSNQILDFTKQIKIMSNKNKIKIIETLWRIVYSNEVADIYEAGLMRKLAGLLYIDSKTMGDIKERIKKEIS
tara:strand:- start:101 stop:514 length:414 start_codon:yes stop_codon:yes gene_type:complete